MFIINRSRMNNKVIIRISKTQVQLKKSFL